MSPEPSTAADPWGAQSHGAAALPRAQAHMAQMGMGIGGMPGGMSGMGVPGMGGGNPGMMPGMGGAGLPFDFGGAASAFGMMKQRQPLSPAIRQVQPGVSDRVGRFMAGPHCAYLFPRLYPSLSRSDP